MMTYAKYSFIFSLYKVVKLGVLFDNVIFLFNFFLLYIFFRIMFLSDIYLCWLCQLVHFSMVLFFGYWGRR